MAEIIKNFGFAKKHNRNSQIIYNFLSDFDLKNANDYFCWKSGGDGDNGEILMDELDYYFKNVYLYRWHNILLNELDLPDMGVGVETITLNTNTGETFYDHNWIIPGGEWAKVGNSANVLKWRYVDNE